MHSAIESNDTNQVMSLCPTLQTLGLEVEARDAFLAFMERTVFIAINADAASVDGATDAATGYAQALSNVFNASYLILQKYLPMVIQGMDASMGDIQFIRRLHSKCEKEAGLVLKRYMKFRNIKDVISSVKLNGANASSKVSIADMHNILDELALLIQYCCMYAKYLKVLCEGAESRKRTHISTNTGNNVNDNKNNKNNSDMAVVFSGPTEFDKMVDELINKYYMEGEHFLLRQSMRHALSSPTAPADASSVSSSGSG